MYRKIICVLLAWVFLLSPIMASAAPAITHPAQSAAVPDPGDAAWDELPPAIQAKVDPRLLAEFRGEVTPAHLAGVPLPAGVSLAPQERTLFLVFLKAKTNLEAVTRRNFANITAQRAAVTDALIATAQRTQAPIRALLDAQRSSGHVGGYSPFYIVNALAVEADLHTVIALARRDDVERIVANYPLVSLDAPNAQARPMPVADLGGLSPENWNIDLVDAERVWDELGVDGTGAVVAGFDTGVQWDHHALQSNYRGWDGTNADHNYNWFEFDALDAAHWPANGDYGASVSSEPYDEGGHGTHTMGTMVGDGGTYTTSIGMAPGARWIAVPGINDSTMPLGSFSYAGTIGGIRSFQWLMCPTDLSGDLSTRDCSKAPDVINNSWGSSAPADETFRPAIQALRAAGIVPVFAAGNPGAGLGSIGSPASVPEALTVGATDIDDQVAEFSGRGPSFYEGVQKPNLTAPGVDVFSAIPGDAYSFGSGTSMAAPAASGLVALIISADLQDGQRDLSVDEIQAFLEHTALDLGAAGHDDEYGYGRIDAYQAVRWALSAGELAGTVRDSASSLPIEGAALSLVRGADVFASQANASGFYSATLPAGVYQVTVAAFGYSPEVSATAVLTGSESTLDFNLAPLPTALLQGTIQAGAVPAPVAGARVYVDARPSLSFTTDSTGSYTLTLPIGTHELTVETRGYRIVHETIDVQAGGVTEDITLEAAPTILLVEADAHLGWFINRPAANFFKWSLDRRNYLYDHTSILTDTLPALSGYDVVIDIHTASAPTPAFSAMLQDYLDNGGRLIVSGQALVDNSPADPVFFNDYLHARAISNNAASLGESVSGQGFLSGLDLTLNEAALYGYANSYLSLAPDAVQPLDGSAFPIMTYDNGAGVAVLAVDPCSADYRAVYFAVGYENLGPRAYNLPEAYADVLDRSLQWLMEDERPAYAVNAYLLPSQDVTSAGSTLTYTLMVANTGAQADTFDLAVSGNLWPTSLYSGTAPVEHTISLAPCAFQAIGAQVEIPASAAVGASDAFTVTTSSQAQPAVRQDDSARTIVFPDWQAHASSNGIPVMWSVGAGEGCTPYAIGGLDAGFTSQRAVQAYDVQAGQWLQKALKPSGVFGTDAASIDGKIYVPGGFTDIMTGNLSPTSTLEIYDPASDTWSQGADMPGVRGGASVAAAGGKLYVFGGQTFSGMVASTVWEYTPASDSWTAKGNMPYAMIFGSATGLGGKVYVGGDYRGYNAFYEYDPVGDTWTQKANLPDGGRNHPVLIGRDGKVYLYGGATASGAAPYLTGFSYDPAGDAWTQISDNLFPHVYGTGAFAAGRLWSFGNTVADFRIESVALGDSFCESRKTTRQDVVRPGDPITYTIELHSEPASTIQAGVSDPLPAGVAFVGFGPGSIAPSPSYNAAENRVEWQGNLPAGQVPVTFTFSVRVEEMSVSPGTWITNTAIITDSRGGSYRRSAESRVTPTTLWGSYKEVTPGIASPGEIVTYTVAISNSSSTAVPAQMLDTIPDGLAYVPGSLSATGGAAEFAGGVITWTGTISPSALIRVQFQAIVDETFTESVQITNTALIRETTSRNEYERSVTLAVAVDVWRLYLPVIVR
ncbi:MAG: S8 family serine peptidase [Chloroflexota bacterium]